MTDPDMLSTSAPICPVARGSAPNPSMARARRDHLLSSKRGLHRTHLRARPRWPHASTTIDALVLAQIDGENGTSGCLPRLALILSIETVMQSKNALGPTEIHGFLRRYNQARFAILVVAIATLFLIFCVPLSFVGWMAVFFGAGVICFLFELRGQRCPHCRGWVLWSGGPSDQSASCPETPGITILNGPPTRCRGCGVLLRTPNGG
jgi:hypothetical protein